MKRGFTLIELLVVVLIIGILAAVALPQYQAAVAKSRMAALLPFMRAAQQSVQRYYMENGKYPTSMEDLDVTCSSFGKDSHEGWCYLDNNKNVVVHLAGSYVVVYDSRIKSHVLLLFWFSGGASCYAYEDDNFELGKKICFGLTGDQNPGGSAGWATTYKFPYKS